MRRPLVSLGCCAALVLTALLQSPAGAQERELWGSVTIVPGRQGLLEVAGYGGPALGAGSRLTLTVSAPAAVTGTPLADGGYRGAVAADGGTGTYTFSGTAAGGPWSGRTFPFVLFVPANAVPGTRLSGCAMVVTDAGGSRRDEGACTVTVGLPEPTLSQPLAGVPLGSRPRTAGTAYPGAQVSVRDQDENEVCSTTAAADGTWWCVPGTDLPAGAGRLQATATFNGVSAESEQIRITVT
ncbi:carboxypeptidase regulatory-like domain-containing protein [Streptomyces sp. NPDC049915]|uniref:carboxypeptidase regulatory-like domain-containing protein n=1 Tax=Streptomyces sp. NPDC049915 TaxID=3155510 RepID=UPI00341F808C